MIVRDSSSSSSLSISSTLGSERSTALMLEKARNSVRVRLRAETARLAPRNSIVVVDDRVNFMCSVVVKVGKFYAAQ